MSSVNPKPNEAKGKRSIALAVTLILLVVSIMLTVMFSSKNIAANQELNVIKGEIIVEHFKSLRSSNEQIIAYVEQALSVQQTESIVARIDAEHTIPYIQSLNDHMVALIDDAAAYKNSRFSTEVPEQLAMLEQWKTELQSIAEGNGELTTAEKEGAQKIVTQGKELVQIIDQFVFQSEGTKNALIRMGNGFDWIEQVEALELHMNAN